MTYLDLHILQTVPPSNINRDDTGSPKTATYGGKTRARVSSQSWKRAARRRFNRSLPHAQIGFRTKHITELVAEKIAAAGDIDDTAALILAAAAIAAAGIDTKKGDEVPVSAPAESDTDGDGNDDTGNSGHSGALVFLSGAQITALAELMRARYVDALAASPEGVLELAPAGKGKKKSVADSLIGRKEAVEALNSAPSLDLALFGRMVAGAEHLNLSGAAQVAHAISVHAVDTEFDYFTAVDDVREARKIAGAGMISTIEFNSSTLYRYASINLDLLAENLGGGAQSVAQSVALFIDAFCRSMPTGKSQTFANFTLPDAVVAVLRDDQPVSLVGAFEKAVTPADEEPISVTAARALAHTAGEVWALYGAPARSWLCTGSAAAQDLSQVFGHSASLAEVVSDVRAAVQSTLESQ